MIPDLGKILADYDVVYTYSTRMFVQVQSLRGYLS